MAAPSRPASLHRARRAVPQPHRLALAVGLACGLGGAAAQTAPDVVLPPVEVIGITPLPGLGVPKEQVPANVQTARDADLQRSNAIDLTSYMNRRLGSVHLNEIQNNPFQPDVNYRGYSASPLLGSQQGLSLYMDGVRLNQPFGDVVSWDLIPKSAISSIALMPGSNPLFGLNTLGGALAIQTKDGLKNPGTAVQGIVGMHKRRAVEFEHGGSAGDSGAHWFVTANKFKEDGWRNDSHSDVNQLFGKLGLKRGDTDVALSAAFADTDLNGNGLQEQRFLDRDYASVYTKPDNTQNRSWLLNLALTQGLSDSLSFSGNAYYRKIKTTTYNGDINDDSLDQTLLNPSTAERNALIAAGYTGIPPVGSETVANTPFPFWRCLGQALLNDEPAEKCTGVINQTRTDQSNYGLAGQLNFEGSLGSMKNLLTAGGALDFSRSHFIQGSQLGYLNPDRSVTGVFRAPGVPSAGDGVNGGDVDGEAYDTRVDLKGRTRTYSVYASDVLEVAPATHLTLSGRYNRTTVKNRDAITPGGGTGSLDGDHTFNRFNPALGITFNPSKAFGAYAGVNQGSRAPSSIELGCADPEAPCKLPNSFAGDPPLKQVVTTTIEAGVRGVAGSGVGAVSWNVGVFRSDNKDDLLFVADDTTGFGYFKNFGKTRRQGVELGASVLAATGVTVGANYTFLDATFRSPEEVDGSSNSSNETALANPATGRGLEGTIDIEKGDRIPLIPRQMLKLFTDVQISDSWGVNLDMTAVGGSLARGNENGQHQPDGRYYLGPGRSGGYAVWNLGADYKPTKGLKLFTQVNNIFDRKYSTAAQLGATGFNAAGAFQARQFAGTPGGTNAQVPHATFYAPGAPRTAWVGVRYQFD